MIINDYLWKNQQVGTSICLVLTCTPGCDCSTSWSRCPLLRVFWPGSGLRVDGTQQSYSLVTSQSSRMHQPAVHMHIHLRMQRSFQADLTYMLKITHVGGILPACYTSAGYHISQFTTTYRRKRQTLHLNQMFYSSTFRSIVLPMSGF